MHSEDGEEDLKISTYYGIAPAVVGILFGGGVIWFMFAVADGFS